MSGSSAAIDAAAWATIASLGLSLLMLLYTLELRLQRRMRERRRARITARWRTVIAAAVAGTEVELSPLPKRERAEFLRLWNVTRNMIEGAAADRLIDLARRLDLVEFVRRDARSGTFGARLAAMQALGHLRDAESFAGLVAAVDEEHVMVSITAAEALAEIDPARAIDVLIPRIVQRRDWPRTHVFRLLQKAGGAAVSEPLFRYIRAASDADAAYLLQFVEIAEFDVRDAIVDEMLRSRQDPDLIAAALKAASGYGKVPRLTELASHPAWYVRMQVARLLGRAGRVEHVRLLEQLLRDTEWWVRYRAARSLASIAASASGLLERVRERIGDRFARDILDQVVAEAAAR